MVNYATANMGQGEGARSRLAASRPTAFDPQLVPRAFELADRAADELIRRECLWHRQSGNPLIICFLPLTVRTRGMVNVLVKKVAQATPRIREAVSWLEVRGLARIICENGQEVICLGQPAPSANTRSPHHK